MNIFCKLTKIIIAGLIVFIASNFLIINPVLAKDIHAGFSAGTMITTPTGEVAIENLEKGDRVIGYNFDTHDREENIVSEIKHKSSLSYYLINNKTKITGTSYLYVKTKDNPKISTVQQLKLNKKLFSKNHNSVLTRSVTQVVEPTEIYQIYLENPIGNLYADNLLVHDSDRLPKLFRKQYIECYNHAGSFYESSNYTRCENINSDNLLDFTKAVAIVIIGTYIIGTVLAKLIIYVRNLIRFTGKQFTDSKELIDFTKSINPNFTNRYSVRYLKGYKVWHKIDLQPNIDRKDCWQVVEEKQLLEETGNLFTRYYRDIVYKRLNQIEKYFPQFSIQNKYQQYYLEQYIIYQPKIIEAAIINFEPKADGTNLFKVQINAKMTNFVISPQGYVLTGESKVQQFSEYWTIKITPENEYLIEEIKDTVTTRIREGDLRAKLEAYGDVIG